MTLKNIFVCLVYTDTER